MSEATFSQRQALSGAKRKIFTELGRSDLERGLRDEYLRIIVENGVTHAENIAKLNDWLIYLFYCRMISYLVPEATASVIDWGGENGHVTQILRTMGYSNVKNYLLYVPGYYDLFQKHFDIPTLYGREANKLDLDDQSVDVLISSGVLEHVREDGNGREDVIVKEIYRVLKPGGFFFIWYLPALLSTSELMCILTKKWHHKYRYRRKPILRMLERAGFDVIYLDKHTILPGSAMGLLGRVLDPVKLTEIDDSLSHMFPLNIFARNFGIVAKRPEFTGASLSHKC